MVLIQYNKIRQHFLRAIIRPGNSRVGQSLAMSGYEVMEYLISLPTTVSNFHILGLLLDPLHKDEIQSAPNITLIEVISFAISLTSITNMAKNLTSLRMSRFSNEKFFHAIAQHNLAPLTNIFSKQQLNTG